MPEQHPHPAQQDSAQKCACVSCNCPIPATGGIPRDGKLYCSKTCAYDCTVTTCVCVHEGCDQKH